MSEFRTSNELRCICARKPLLATYGLTRQGEIYVHVKVYKQSRLFGEMIVVSGTVMLHCRDCLRWQQIKMVGRRAELESAAPHDATLVDVASVADSSVGPSSDHPPTASLPVDATHP